jgi:Type IV secretion system pilin
MIQKIKNALLVLVTMSMTIVPAVVPSNMVFAACSNIGTQVGQGASGAANNGSATDICNTGTGTSNQDISTIASKIVNVFSIIVGAVSILMIIYGGFRYITSGGATERVGNAKNTLLYAIIGLIVVALAQLIVHFVLNFASSNVPTTS